MLCVSSGLSSPCGASRVIRRSRSSASGARLKSRVLTSISSSSTPNVSADEDLNESAVIDFYWSIARAGLAFAGTDERVTRGDRPEQVQDRDARHDDGREPRAEFGRDVVDRLRHPDG